MRVNVVVEIFIFNFLAISNVRNLTKDNSTFIYIAILC